MPIKYYCRKCEKRYVEWGAEKLSFLCPTCEGEQLVRVGGGTPGKSTAKPSLRLREKRPVVDREDEGILDEVEEDAPSAEEDVLDTFEDTGDSPDEVVEETVADEGSVDVIADGPDELDFEGAPATFDDEGPEVVDEGTTELI